MIPAAFDYVRAGSAEEAISLIGEHGEDAKFLAGGHSLLPLMKLRLAQPTVLVDIGRVNDLSYINDAGDHIAIGALTRHMDIENSDLLREHVPLLAHAIQNAAREQELVDARERGGHQRAAGGGGYHLGVAARESAGAAVVRLHAAHRDARATDR